PALIRTQDAEILFVEARLHQAVHSLVCLVDVLENRYTRRSVCSSCLHDRPPLRCRACVKKGQLPCRATGRIMLPARPNKDQAETKKGEPRGFSPNARRTFQAGIATSEERPPPGAAWSPRFPCLLERRRVGLR